MPGKDKLDRCVEKVKKQSQEVRSPGAVCKAAFKKAKERRRRKNSNL